MKKLLIAAAALVALAGSAGAADLGARPAYTKAPVAAPVYDWTGFYVGAEGGAAWMSNIVNNIFPGSVTGTLHDTGALAGGTVGYNWQFSQWVWGLEADYSWADPKTLGSTSGNCTAAPFGCETKLNNFGTARGRLGYTVLPSTLAYATGGFAWGDVKSSLLGTTGSENTTQTGWTVGGGLETVIMGNWTAKAEYLYADLGKGGSYVAPGPPGVINQPQNVHVQVARVGINYKFGWK